VLHIPRDAFTIDGFREWVKSDALPEKTRVTFVSGEMWLDFRGAGLCLHIPAKAQTLDGFREWVKSDELPEKMRVTFVNGEITLDMSKEELETHNKVKTAVTVALVNLDPDARAGNVYTDGVLITNAGATVSNNPDGVYLTRESRRAGRVRMVQRKGKAGQYLEIAGAPDWVMEVVSDSSVKKDRQTLRKSYHKAGIREYWLIDARGQEIDFQILVWEGKGYAAAPQKGAWQRSAVFGRFFRLTRRRDEDGDWQYRLDSRVSPR
jgi:Uma2 family endonuclease